MQLPWDEHFYQIVIPAWQAYRSAEAHLTEVVSSKNEGLLNCARYTALREAGAACFYVHHFGEIVLRANPRWLSADVKRPDDVVRWLSQFCVMMRTDRKVDDVSLLRDVADALKHAILSRHLDERQVSANEAVLVIATGFGEMSYGEGKYGGADQVVIATRSGKRALSSVLQNVIDAWRRSADIPLPEVGAS
jgi:hypothetical protein